MLIKSPGLLVIFPKSFLTPFQEINPLPLVNNLALSFQDIKCAGAALINNCENVALNSCQRSRNTLRTLKPQDNSESKLMKVLRGWRSLPTPTSSRSQTRTLTLLPHFYAALSCSTAARFAPLRCAHRYASRHFGFVQKRNNKRKRTQDLHLFHIPFTLMCFPKRGTRQEGPWRQGARMSPC